MRVGANGQEAERGDGPGSDKGYAMGQHSAQAELQVIVAKDAQSAELSIPPNLSAEQMTVEALTAALQTAQVEITPAVTEALERIASEPRCESPPCRVVVARATPPVHGVDGRVEWLVDEGSPAPVDEHGNICFYEQSAFTMVTAGQVLGRVVPPTQGVEGRDVFGKPIAAKNGQPADPKLDETISHDENADLVAQIAGVFTRKGPKPTIRELLEVQGCVDFSTGNINFDGEVSVRGGVRDLFRVVATGRIEIRGLVEAATVECEGDLILAGGMAGREHGLIRAGGSVTARHLSASRLIVRGDLNIDKEMMGCHATVSGRVLCPKGSILGGRLVCSREWNVAVFGSQAGVETIIELGSLPLLRARVTKLDDVIDQHLHVLRTLVGEREAVARQSARPGSRVGERLRAVTAEMHRVNEELKVARHEREEAEALIADLKAFTGTVTKCLHAGTIFAVGRRLLRVYMDVLGPLQITVAESGQILVHPEDAAAIPLDKIARPFGLAA